MTQISEAPYTVTQRITADEDAVSHRGTTNIDISNKNKVIAPFDMIIKGIYRGGNTVFFESLEPVKTPAFTDYVCGLVSHDNVLNSNAKVGSIVKKGEYFYDPGSKVNGSVSQTMPAHIHIGFGRGKLGEKDSATGGYWIKDSKTGNYKISSTGGPIHAWDAYFVPDDMPISRQYENVPHVWLRTSDAKEDDNLSNFKYVNQNDGSSSLRKVPVGIFAWVKKEYKPKLDYKRVSLSNGGVMYALKVERSENVIISPSYSEVPKNVMDLKNPWFENNGYELLFACNTSYFIDGSSNPNWGKVTGGLLLDWSTKWCTYKDTFLYPNKGKGYPTMWSDGTKIYCNDEWLDPFFSSKSKNGELYWAMSVGQSDYLNGEQNRSLGKENGRANNYETKPTIGWCKDGSFVCVGFTKKGVTTSQRQDYIAEHIKDWGIDSLFDCDGNGSTFMAFNMDIINNSPAPEPTPDPEPEPNKNETKWFKCSKGTLNGGLSYPTRPSKDGAYDPKNNFIQKGEYIRVKSMHSNTKNSDVLCEIEKPDRLKGRWFAYDNNNFE